AGLHHRGAESVQVRRALASIDAGHRGELERGANAEARRVLRSAGEMKLVLLLVSFAFAANVHAGDAAKGQQKAQQVCAACHGPDGNKPSAPDQPVLAGQYYDYLVRALSDYKSGARSNGIMKGFAGQLSKQDIEDLAAWFSSQKSALHDQR